MLYARVHTSFYRIFMLYFPCTVGYFVQCVYFICRMNHFFLSGIGLSCPRIAKKNPLRGAMWSSRSPAALSILIYQKTHLIVAPIQSRTLSVSAASVSTSDASSSTSEEGSRWPADARVQSSAEAHSRASPPRRRRPTRAHKPRVENVARRGTLPRCRRRMHQRMLRRWGLHPWRARQADQSSLSRRIKIYARGINPEEFFYGSGQVKCLHAPAPIRGTCTCACCNM